MCVADTELDSESCVPVQFLLITVIICPNLRLVS